MSTHTSAAEAVAASLQDDLREIAQALTDSQGDLASGNVNGAIGAAAAVEATVARVTALYPALLLLLRQQRP